MLEDREVECVVQIETENYFSLNNGFVDPMLWEAFKATMRGVLISQYIRVAPY